MERQRLFNGKGVAFQWKGDGIKKQHATYLLLITLIVCV